MLEDSLVLLPLSPGSDLITVPFLTLPLLFNLNLLLQVSVGCNMLEESLLLLQPLSPGSDLITHHSIHARTPTATGVCGLQHAGRVPAAAAAAVPWQ